MTFGDVTNAQGTCRNINHVIQGECFQAQPGRAWLWKRAIPLPPSALLSKHTQPKRNFLVFAWLHEECMVQPLGPSPNPTAVLLSVLPPWKGGKEHLLAFQGKSRMQPRATGESQSPKSLSKSLLTGWGFRYFPSLMTSVFIFISTNTHPMENLDCSKYLNLT